MYSATNVTILDEDRNVALSKTSVVMHTHTHALQGWSIPPETMKDHTNVRDETNKIVWKSSKTVKCVSEVHEHVVRCSRCSASLNGDNSPTTPETLQTGLDAKQFACTCNTEPTLSEGQEKERVKTRKAKTNHGQ